MDQVVDYVAAIVDIRESPGGRKLSNDTKRILALIVSMPDLDKEEQRLPQSEILRRALRNYDNPRRMPKGWIDRYIGRDSELLAIDVMRAFDKNCKVEKQLERARIIIWILTSAVVGCWSVILILGKFVLEHYR